MNYLDLPSGATIVWLPGREALINAIKAKEDILVTSAFRRCFIGPSHVECSPFLGNSLFGQLQLCYSGSNVGKVVLGHYTEPNSITTEVYALVDVVLAAANPDSETVGNLDGLFFFGAQLQASLGNMLLRRDQAVSEGYLDLPTGLTVIVGRTGSAKTPAGKEIAKKFGGKVISIGERDPGSRALTAHYWHGICCEIAKPNGGRPEGLIVIDSLRPFITVPYANGESRTGSGGFERGVIPLLDHLNSLALHARRPVVCILNPQLGNFDALVDVAEAVSGSVQASLMLNVPIVRSNDAPDRRYSQFTKTDTVSTSYMNSQRRTWLSSFFNRE